MGVDAENTVHTSGATGMCGTREGATATYTSVMGVFHDGEKSAASSAVVGDTRKSLKTSHCPSPDSRPAASTHMHPTTCSRESSSSRPSAFPAAPAPAAAAAAPASPNTCEKTPAST